MNERQNALPPKTRDFLGQGRGGSLLQRALREFSGAQKYSMVTMVVDTLCIHF